MSNKASQWIATDTFRLSTPCPAPGIGIVASVVGILVFVMMEAWPLFRPAQGRRVGTVSLASAPDYVAPEAAAAQKR